MRPSSHPGTSARDTNADQPEGEPADSTTTVDPIAPSEPAETSWRFWPLVAIVVAAVILTGFGFWSQTVHLPNGYFKHPPIYGFFIPTFSRLGLTLIPAGLLLATTAWAVTTYRRLPTWLALVMIVASGLVTSVAVNVLRGKTTGLTQGASATRGPFISDLHFVDQLGVRGFVEHYPTIVGQLHTYNGKTHPPGVEVLVWTVSKIVNLHHPFRFTTLLAVISLTTALGAWALARSYGGERAGRIAAVLAVAAPGPLMLAYTSVDAIFATLFAASAALFVIGARRRSIAFSAGAGAVLALATFLTYATAFLAAAAVVAIAVETRSLRQTAKLLAAAAVGGLAMLLVLRLAVGFDLLASYHAMTRSNGPYYPYWIAGSAGAWLLFAGLPLTALGLAGLVIKVPAARRPILPLVLIAGMLVWGTLPPHVTALRQGEVERTWAFLYPMLAAAAGPVIDRWVGSARVTRFWAAVIVPGLVIVSVAQTGILQALWDNLT